MVDSRGGHLPTVPDPSPRHGAMKYTYFIQCETSGPIKIGVAYRPTERLKELQTAHHSELRLVGAIQGAEETEREWHYRFAEYRIRGEWFEASPELLAEIEKVTRR